MARAKRRARKKRVPRRSPGRPSEYTPELASHICSELAAGKSLVKICEDPNMPGRRTVFDWLRAHPEFEKLYQIAKDECAEVLVEEMLEIADNGGRAGTSEKVQRDRVRIDTRKWIASKLKPKKYSEKVAAEVSGPEGGPVVVEIVRFSDMKRGEGNDGAPGPATQ